MNIRYKLEVFMLKQDWHIGQEFLKTTDPILKNLIDKYGNCTLQPIDSSLYFTALIKGIISQQLSPEVANTIYTNVKTFYGTNILSPREILATTTEVFKSLGLSALKADYIHDLSKNVEEQTIILNKFPELTDNEIINQLLPVKGFGRWTAEMFLILALNRPNLLPLDDFGLKKSMQLLYKIDPKAKKAAYNEIAKNWEPWRTLACWYLWQFYSDNK